ncbi:hypothetical protein V6B05_01930 [Lactococcus garvieae]|uniref:hypothetical protein n=1 Tax=Lactococcus garvieae TaxID=1363 RepID=UPI001F6187E2|nr:hypothetical protein [Lactococcus garvieae]MCI3860185.1 hypothetical protein [Lactococcus garvieae]
MTEAEIIESIIHDIEFLGYSTVALPVDRPYTNGKKKVVIYPISSTPFELAHEMVHAKYGDSHRNTLCDITSPQEKRANKEAIIYLWNLFESEGGNFNYFSLFIDVTGCPYEKSYSIIRNIYEEQYAI